MNKVFGMCFSKDLVGDEPLAHIGEKISVYIELLRLLKDDGWDVYVLTRKTYKGDGVFGGGWVFDSDNFVIDHKIIKVDVVYDRTGGLNFPIPNEESVVVNNYDFKKLAWDKWEAYKLLGKYMPKSFLVNNKTELEQVIPQINTEKIVVKPISGLQGMGVFIGNKLDVLGYDFSKKYSGYIAQEFLDTSGGIENLVDSPHDLRVVIINNKIVWSHIRRPQKGSFLSNAAQGGSLDEVDIDLIPSNVKEIVKDVSNIFYDKYDNPIYSLDFGIGIDGIPKIFEINDQMGFPKKDMKYKDNFLKELVANFNSRL